MHDCMEDMGPPKLPHFLMKYTQFKIYSKEINIAASKSKQFCPLCKSPFCPLMIRPNNREALLQLHEVNLMIALPSVVLAYLRYCSL